MVLNKSLCMLNMNKIWKSVAMAASHDTLSGPFKFEDLDNENC